MFNLNDFERNWDFYGFFIHTHSRFNKFLSNTQKIAGDKKPKGWSNTAHERVFDEVLRRSGALTSLACKWGYAKIAAALSKPCDYEVS